MVTWFYFGKCWFSDFVVIRTLHTWWVGNDVWFCDDVCVYNDDYMCMLVIALLIDE